MFASIQSQQFHEFYCRIMADPVQAFRNILVYELVNPSIPNDIIKKVNGEYAGTFRHIALDTDGNGYLFDIQSKKLSGNVGKCTYIAD
ncbi:hypothetical protein [Shewanella algae]|uniref:hypothetical protein n=1 Tax=Shewanella algae TaxID=38313 RepID=UPI001AAD73A9|nr:hypothetical protein [Shewanella algae]QTE84012.1 hypothetical protein JKK46_09195 [Shewanella algae]